MYLRCKYGDVLLQYVQNRYIRLRQSERISHIDLKSSRDKFDPSYKYRFLEKTIVVL